MPTNAEDQSRYSWAVDEEALLLRATSMNKSRGSAPAGPPLERFSSEPPDSRVPDDTKGSSVYGRLSRLGSTVGRAIGRL